MSDDKLFRHLMFHNELPPEEIRSLLHAARRDVADGDNPEAVLRDYFGLPAWPEFIEELQK